MAFNFITPNLMVQVQSRGLKALGLDISVERLCAEMEDLYNTARQRGYIEKTYVGVIPEDLPICVISNRDSREIMDRYGIPETGRQVAAAVAPGIDDRYPLVLLLAEEYMWFKTVIDHEVVHYHQFNNGHLVTTSDGRICWTKPGEEYSIDALADAVKTHGLSREGDDFLWHELQKPWELEAYALSTPEWEMRHSFSERCQRKISEFLERKGL